MAFRHVSKAIRECDLFISGGGSLLQDATSLRSLFYYLGVIHLARLYHRKVMILGQGIGPLRRAISRRLTASALDGVDLITVRDAASSDLLREIGVSHPPIRVTADPTLTLEPCPMDVGYKALRESGILPGEEVVAVSLREWEETPEIRQAVVDALRVVSRSLPTRILLLTMHCPRDSALAKRVRKAVGGLATQPREWSSSEMLGVLKNCRMVVSMRLHALIFSASVGVSTIGIAYDPKVEHFLAAARQMSVSLEQTSSGLLAEKILEAWGRRGEFEANLAQTMPAMKLAAHENIRLALELLS